MTAEVLTRKKGLMENISPTGVKYTIELVQGGNALYRIKSNKGGPEILELAGYYTSMPKAQVVLTKFLNARWDESDAQAAKNAKRNAA